MKWFRAHPVSTTLLALAVAIATVVAIAVASGFDEFLDAFGNLHPEWLAVVVLGELAALPAYVFAYRALARLDGGPKLRLQLVLRLVIAGFGPFAAAGGFRLDQRALHAIGGDERAATVRVLGLGAFEWALLAPAAWLCAVLLLVFGRGRVMSSLLWPWAIAVPVGFTVGLWLAEESRVKCLRAGPGRWRVPVGKALRSVGVLRSLAGDLRTHWGAWISMALVWAFDIASFYAAIRFVGLRLALGPAIIAYATGYALTRRSMPLGGAGLTEALMTLSLHWVGQRFGPALAAVVVYRMFNFVLPAIPALIVRPRLRPLLAAADAGTVPAPEERRQAAVPLGPLGRS